MTEPVFPLSDYEIGELIGQGQFGEVRRAHWTPRGIEVALKKIAASASDAVNKIKAEQRGAELQQRLGVRDKGLVPELYQDGLDANGDYYIAMERIAGQSLAEVMKSAPRPSRETAQMGLALADFLRKLHGLSESDNTEEPIVHSDLKPDHVLVLADGSIRVLDLGIAKTLRANRALTVNFWASAPYASPERLEDGNVRLGDDLWAVGVMLFEMACREHPYQAYMVDDNNAALARAIRRSEPQGAIHRDCDEHLAAIIRKMLAPQPSHRYQTADDVAADLTRYLDGEAPLAAAESARASTATQVIPAPTSRQFRPLDTVPTDPLPPELFQAAAAPEPVSPCALAPLCLQGAPPAREAACGGRRHRDDDHPRAGRGVGADRAPARPPGPRRGHRHRAAAHRHQAHPGERAVSLGVVGAVAAGGDRADAPHRRSAHPRLPAGPLRLAAAVAGGAALAGAGRGVQRRGFASRREDCARRRAT